MKLAQYFEIVSATPTLNRNAFYPCLLPHTSVLTTSKHSKSIKILVSQN